MFIIISILLFLFLFVFLLSVFLFVFLLRPQRPSHLAVPVPFLGVERVESLAAWHLPWGFRGGGVQGSPETPKPLN